MRLNKGALLSKLWGEKSVWLKVEVRFAEQLPMPDSGA